MELTAKLDRLYGLQRVRANRENEKQVLIESLIPDDVKYKIKEIEEEFANDPIAQQIETLEKEVKEETLALGQTVKGNYYMVTFNKGRVSWDATALDAYSIDHPEILRFRTEGKPSTSLRKIA